jgi:peptide chain release factor 1
MIPVQRMQEILERFAFIEAKMNSVTDPAEIAQLGRDYSGLLPVVATIRDWQQADTDLAAARDMLDDPDMRSLAEEEITGIETRIPALEEAVRLALLPRDAADERAAILEIRPGTGGDEAALFAGDLLRMYLRFAESQGWKVEILDESPAELGGYKEVVAAIRGKGVFAKLKFESGVHRVQRVPVTEAGGRIHTSAATVAVLPEAEEIDASTPCGPRVLAGSTSTPPTRRCGSPIFRPASLLPRRRSRSTRTGRGRWKFCAPGSMMPSASDRMPIAPPSARARLAPATGRSEFAPITFRKGA